MFDRVVKVLAVVGATVQVGVSASVVTALALVTLTSFGVIPMPV